MQLGNFSVSLAVKSLAASRTFYEAIGFSVIGGDAEQKWLILRNDGAIIGLFEGMFEQNILTFNPGWDQGGGELGQFEDIRDLQRRLRERGIQIVSEADDSSDGPASMILADPDGNTILIDQHVPRPQRSRS
ncbi:MAG TPA: hypothetical protein PKC43_07875 [Phycisphaerales bacterium]|nr:hypothetical protein [Phycisphaerales bacterium]HMP37355.1 hypothetical protein [Phycisphaerales bacterium]